MADIKLSPDQLRDYAKKIRGNGQASADLARQIKANIDAVTSNWEGNRKDKYLQDWAQIQPTLERTVPEMLETLAQNLETNASNFENADR